VSSQSSHTDEEPKLVDYGEGDTIYIQYFEGDTIYIYINWCNSLHLVDFCDESLFPSEFSLGVTQWCTAVTYLGTCT
jgi:hypothetical protein